MTHAELRKIALAATQGEWVNRPSGVVQVDGGNGPIIFWDDTAMNPENYGYIAAFSPAQALRLLDEVQALRDGLEAIRKVANSGVVTMAECEVAYLADDYLTRADRIREGKNG